MEISRGGKERQWTNDMERTDSTAPSQYVNGWKYRGGGGPYGRFEGGSILFSGTRKRDPERAAELQVRISDDDVCALFNALLERKAEDEQRLRDTLQNIDELLSESNLPSEFDEDSTFELIRNVRTLVRSALEIHTSYGSEQQTRKSEAPNWNPFRKAVLEP